MQQDSALNLVVYHTDKSVPQPALSPELPTLCFKRFSQLKKHLRSNEVSVVLLVTGSNASEEVRQVSRYLREGLANYSTRILVLAGEDQRHYEQQWLDDFAIDAVYPHDLSDSLLNARLKRQHQSYAAQKQRLYQSEIQTDLLLSVTQFSQARSAFQDLIAQFATALSGFCYSGCSLIFRRQQNDQLACEQVSGLALTDAQVATIAQGPLSRIVESSFSLSTPQLELVTQTEQIDALNTLNIPSSSYVSFPIVVYGKVLAVVLCFIRSDAMDAVSVKQIDIMKDAALQLRNLLERRTAENRLKSQYQRLKSTLLELKSTQDQLIQSEKMASVGQLAAGIAHEVNNPMSFVLSNFKSMDEYVNTMVKMLSLHDEFVRTIQNLECPESSALKENIHSFRENADLDFVLEDIWEVVNESRQGLIRVRDIVSDLQSFCHKQEVETAAVDIRTLVEETLRMLRYELVGNVTINSDIQLTNSVNAHRGFLQQVLVNLVVNATHALNDLERPVEDKQITLSAWEENQQVILKVRDNGPGIPDKVQKRIFEPFFTTKEVGKGTGLGLSVSYNLIQKMQGQIAVESAPNQFTEFTITLPQNPVSTASQSTAGAANPEPV